MYKLTLINSKKINKKILRINYFLYGLQSHHKHLIILL